MRGRKREQGRKGHAHMVKSVSCQPVSKPAMETEREKGLKKKRGKTEMKTEKSRLHYE